MRTRTTVLGLALWVVIVGGGFASLMAYQTRPGPAGTAPASWPSGSGLRPQGWTLVVLAHPYCTCTRATLAELERLMAHAGSRLTAYVVVMQMPPGFGADAERDLSGRAGAIPGVRVVRDAHGREAARFGAETSGVALLYDPQGHLQFHGGLTSARGHEGDNAGRTAVLALISGTGDALGATPVFGCSLYGAGERPAGGGA